MKKFLLLLLCGFAFADNKVINGNLDFYSRGGATSTSSGYLFDRFKTQITSTGVIQQSKQTTVPASTSANVVNSLQIQATTAEASPASTSRVDVSYNMEGNDLLELRGRTMTMSFWVRSPKTGVHCFSMANAGGTRSYVTTYSISSANTFEKKTITLKHDSSGTWSYDNALGARFSWSVLGGSNFQASTLNTWLSGNFTSHSSCANTLDATSAPWYLTQVMLNQGSKAEPFSLRGGSIAGESGMVKRYYEKSYNFNVAPGALDASGVNTYILARNSITSGMVQLSEEKRTTPTVVIYSHSTGASGVLRNQTSASDNAATGEEIGTRAFRVNSAVPSDQDIVSYHWTADAEF